VLVLSSNYDRPTQLSWFYENGRAEPLADLGQQMMSPSLAPDARRAALIQIESGQFSTWLVDLADGKLTRLGQRDRGLHTPVWNPSGTRIAGLALNSGRNELRVFDLGSGTDSLLVQSNHEWGITTGWSAPANVVLFGALVEGRGMDIRYVSLGATRVMRDYLATPANEGAAALSPDGRWIAYWSDASGTYDVIVDRFPSPSGARRVATGPAPSAQAAVWSCQVWWAGDGRSLLYRRLDGDEIMTVDVRTDPTLGLGPPRPVLRLPEGRYGVDYDPNGRRFLVALAVGTPQSSLTVIQNWERQLEAAR
jgi:Tol biopolymer transport system component